MEYMTTTEDAEKWGVNIRQVQRLIAANRIPGAKRYQRLWLIPQDTADPGDRHNKKRTPQNDLQADFAYILSADKPTSPRGNPESVLDTISDGRLRGIAEGVFAYMRGDFEGVKERYIQNKGDDAVQLYWSGIPIAAAISTGDYALYTEIEIFLKSMIEGGINDEITAYAELSLASAYLGASAPKMIPEWIKNGDFSLLPPQAIPNAAQMRARYFHCTGNYEALLNVAQTALSFFDSPNGQSIQSVYLRIMCAFAYFATGRAKEAKLWLLDVMDILLPHGFITPFAEHYLIFGGLMEQCITQKYPQYHKTVVSQAKDTLGNWFSFHNHFTKDNIRLILSMRDYQIALLVSRGVPYKQIAEQFHLSVGTLKNIMTTVYESLLITENNRKRGLSKYLL